MTISAGEHAQDARRWTCPKGFGFILRTAGFGKTKTDAEARRRLPDASVEGDGEADPGRPCAPCELYTESDLLIRTVRDVLRPSIDAIIVDSESAFERADAFLEGGRAAIGAEASSGIARACPSSTPSTSSGRSS